MNKSIINRFMAKVDTSGECHEWTAGKYPSGHGSFWMDGRSHIASRIAWEIANGPIPAGTGYHGTVVRHSCDNPGCVNPEHLEIGTVADNNLDRAVRGRNADFTGENNPQSKLTISNILEIRSLASENTHQAIARQFGVCRATVTAIISGPNWRHI